MAMLESSYDRLLLKVLYGVSVLAVCFPFCLSAVENCRPCGPGEYCSQFFGICLACKDYCPRDTDCPSACPPIKVNFTTTTSTKTGPTSTQSDTTTVASAVAVQQSTNANIPSGGDNTFSDNGKGHLVLPVWLVVLLSFLSITVFIIFFVLICLMYHNKLKMPIICRFGNSENGTEIELEERPRSNGSNKTPGRYTTVNGDDVDGHDITDQPGPFQPDSSGPSRFPRPNAEAAAAADPTHSASTTPGPTSIQIHTPSQSMTTSKSAGTSGVVVQSARVHPNENPLLESETLLGACPSDPRSSPRRTPETHRKITDGSNEGHEVSTGASSFNPPNGMCEDSRWERHSGDGD